MTTTIKALIVVLCVSSGLAVRLSGSRAAVLETQNANVAAGAGANAAELFDAKCAKCHGKDGKAKTLAGRLKSARNFTDVKWQESVNDERLTSSIMNGKGGMPAFGKKLSGAEIASLVAYVREFRNSSDQK
jgi:mono/diheme cytochrome c family protein